MKCSDLKTWIAHGRDACLTRLPSQWPSLLLAVALLDAMTHFAASSVMPEANSSPALGNPSHIPMMWQEMRTEQNNFATMTGAGRYIAWKVTV